MRILAIDYGSKKIGLALSDPKREMAFPHSVILNTNFSETAGKIIKIIADNNVDMVLMGRSLNYKRQENPIMIEARKFLAALQKNLKIEVDFEDETLSSEGAKRGQGKNKMLDASSAALVLSTYIERKKNNALQ